MKTIIRFILALMFAIALPPLARAEEAPKAKADLGRNAALLYWVAFDQYDAAVKVEALGKAVDEYAKAEIDSNLLAILKENTALSHLRLAGTMDACDWGTTAMLAEQGPFTLMPHLQRCRQLARLGLLSVRANLNQKKGAAAVDDVLAVYALARNSQSGGLIISLLVGISIESMVNQTVADQFAMFDDQALRALRDRLAKRPPMLSARVSILAERDGFGNWIRGEVVKLKDRTLREKLFALLMDDAQGRYLKMLVGMDQKEAVAMVDEMLQMYGDLAKTCDLPIDQARKAQSDWEKKIADSKNVVAKLMMPAMGRIDENHRRSLAMNAILAAVITLRLDGRAAFDAIKDPYGDGPFTLKTTDDGMEVSSKFESTRAQPVMLKVKWKPAP